MEHFAGRQPWIVPFLRATEGLTAEQAASAPARMNSPWSIVGHVALWHRIVLGRLRGLPEDDELARASGWDLAARGPEAEWTAARAHVRKLNADLAALVAVMPDADLGLKWAPGRATRWQLLHGLVVHNAYHTGEVITTRQAMRLWNEDRP